MPKFKIETCLPEILTLKNRNRYLVEGWIVGPSRMNGITIHVGNKAFTSKDIELHRPDIRTIYFPESRSFSSVFSGFSIPVIIDPVAGTEVLDIVFDATFTDGTEFTSKIGTVSVNPWQDREYPLDIPPHIDRQNLLVICMATYNPGTEPFQRQIDSIIGQDYQNWICLICDDNSSESCKAGIKAAIKGDQRFSLIENDNNVGFYYNFERCLELVPKIAKYVALSDQDDIWYPHKLTKCLDAFKDRTMLVYCDMNIVDKDRNVLSGTYWKNRKNYYQSEDIDLLTLANTVTGAASVFRRELLDSALPFPPRYGDVFHDHWLAILAAGNGGIEYVDEPLYEYVQYGHNVFGHSDFCRQSYLEFIKNYLCQDRQGRSIVMGLCKRLGTALRGIPSYVWYTFRLKHFLARHVITLAETALLRKLDPDAILLIKRIGTIRGLSKIHLKVHKNKETLNDLEYQLLFGEISGILFRLAIPLFSLYVGSRLEKRMLARVKAEVSDPEC